MWIFDEATQSWKSGTHSKPITNPPVEGSPTAWLGWMEPRYFVNGTGTQTIATAAHFDGDVSTYSLQGSPPSGVTINSGTGVISVPTTSDIPWTTLVIRAANVLGYAEIELDIWVFTPDYTLTGGAAFSTISPTAGSIVAVRSATYTARQNISGWSGTAGNPTRIVKYPGDTVIFNSNSLSTADTAHILVFGAHDIEIRGFEFSDNASTYFGIWLTTATGIKIAQNDMHGYLYQCVGSQWGDSRTGAHPFTAEYNHIHANAQDNNPLATGGTGWPNGMNVYVTDNVVFRRNRVWNNYGEGLNMIGCNYGTIEENIVWNNFSIGILVDNCRYCEIHRNIIWATDPAFYFQGTWPGISVSASNEPYGSSPPEQLTTGHVITNNLVHSGIGLPSYAYNIPPATGPGTSVFSPNTVFSQIDSRWANGPY